jgi:nucleoside-diphosphate-sugar epimerase
VPAGRGKVDELQPCAPTTPYGAAKLAQTRLALASSRPVVVVRPTNVIGPGMPRALALGRFSAELGTAPRRDEPGPVHVLSVGDLSAIRDMIDVRDAVRLIWALATNDEAVGQIVNVGTGAGASIGDALDLMVRAFDRRVEVRASGSGSERSHGASAFVADIDKLEGLLGPQRFIPLADSIERIASETEGAG